ncbi:sulfite exporter TauE/SafE family protein [uncultured Sunxiuqinia sp.]|uniref:sulfite exporter TauE/SafE family protein n=1 Tax=uncultured Sunxiuqinia sp. TaxID=1573825 RepID=UPI0030DAF545|tara:strand:- start:80093 stop:80866 length:774 start_codon:yes stop_codon:yes gene_type:complete
MEIILISLAAFFTAILTFFSGFGLGTILMPVFALFFPVDIAIALTGVVHFTNNLFKMALVGKLADKAVLVRFGIPAILASFAGAWLLLRISNLPSIYQYELSGKEFEITPVKLIIAILLLLFSITEVVPAAQRIQFSRNKLILGGALSGFFGGLAGIQGALRSAFLIKSGLSKEAYIATSVIIASLVDFTRLTVYASSFAASGLSENKLLLFSATLAAIAGAYLGSKLLTKITLRFIQLLVATMLVLISIGLGAGII